MSCCERSGGQNRVRETHEEDEDLGVKAHDPRGFIQVCGSWYLDVLPEVLRDADRVVNAVRKKHGEAAGKLAKAEAARSKHLLRPLGILPSADDEFPESDAVDATDEAEMTIDAARKLYGGSSRILRQAEGLYAQQLEHREKFRLKSTGRISPDGTRRYSIPIEAPDYSRWKAQPLAQQGQSVLMKLPRARKPRPPTPAA